VLLLIPATAAVVRQSLALIGSWTRNNCCMFRRRQWRWDDNNCTTAQRCNNATEEQCNKHWGIGTNITAKLKTSATGSWLLSHV